MECLREVERIDIEEERVECDAAQPLATISPDNFVIIDDQAAQVLSAQSRRGRLYKIYRATKLLLVSPPEVSSNDKGYDTSNWEDVNKTGKRDPDYIDATLAAEHVNFNDHESEVNIKFNIVSCCIQVKSGISSKFSGISGYKYEVCKFKIIESKDIKYGTPVRDYFLKVNQIICMKHLYIL